MKKFSAALLLPLLFVASEAQAQSTTSPSVEVSSSQTQAGTQIRGSKFIGQTVYNKGNEKIGDIADVIIDPNGNVASAIVGVGGFLGVGEKDVAINFSSLKVSRTDDGKVTVVLDTTKDVLRAAPAYTYYKAKS